MLHLILKALRIFVLESLILLIGQLLLHLEMLKLLLLLLVIHFSLNGLLVFHDVTVLVYLLSFSALLFSDSFLLSDLEFKHLSQL